MAEPAAILAHLNEVLLRRQDPGVFEPEFCTAVIAVVEPGPDGITVDLAVAGHPLPLHLTAEGSVTPAGVPGSMLGFRPDVVATTTTLRLGAAEALVCVTDGVLERRHSQSFFGESGLSATLLQARASDAEQMADAVATATLAFGTDETTDDLAVLVLRAPEQAIN